jgi:hypothetical protein
MASGHPYIASAQTAQKTPLPTVTPLLHVPVSIKQLYNNPIDFKLALKKFLCDHSFYTLDEYFDYKHDKNNVTIHL